MFFDFIARISRQYRSMRLVYAVYNVSRPLFTPALIDIHDGEPDPEDPNEKNRIIFREFATIKVNEFLQHPHAPSLAASFLQLLIVLREMLSNPILVDMDRDILEWVQLIYLRFKVFTASFCNSLGKSVTLALYFLPVNKFFRFPPLFHQSFGADLN